MRKATVGLMLVVSAALVATALLIGGGGAPASAGGLPGLASHREQLSFTLPPGGSKSFPLPAAAAKSGAPVRIDVSMSLHNRGTQTPSELMSALANRDPDSSQFTWIGTNSDGSQKGANSLGGADIANIFGGGPSTINASLMVDNASAGTLKITQNRNTTARDGYYIVTISQ